MPTLTTVRRWITLVRPCVLAAALVVVPSEGSAAPSSWLTAPPIRAAASSQGVVADFYRSRQGAPLWFSATSGDAAKRLLTLLGTAEVDGLSSYKDRLGELLIALRQASASNVAARERAELMFSQAFVSYAAALQRDPRVGVIYVDQELKPSPSPALALLEEAAKSPSLAQYVSELGWMNPIYGQLRQALITRETDKHQRHLLALNLQRARALPRTVGRYVLVNAANEQLYMYEDGAVVDEMKVVVGRADAQTPLMNAYIRFAILNPYWNVPSDLTARLAPKVLKSGLAYLNKQGYEVVADFGENARIFDPSTVDWKSVATGKLQVQMRQLPGPANSMGQVKFMFPNSQGVWLHDTPATHLFDSVTRAGSAGCIRLEDAWRLGSWLFRGRLNRTTGQPELQVELPEPVPLYITYLTAIPDGTSIRFVEDFYRRDLPPLPKAEAS